MRGHLFDAAYREEVKLTDGSLAVLRLVTPEDKPLLVEGLAHLSDQARYLRFFAPKKRFSADELAYLTEVDQDRHFAIGATARDAEGKDMGLGIARFVKDPSEPGVAEPAIVVVDAAQRKGLGRVLLARLIAAACERDVTTFRSEVLAENTAIRKLLHDIAPDGTTEEGAGDTLTVRMRLPSARTDDPSAAEEQAGALYRLLRLAAEGLVRVAEALRSLTG